MPNRSRQEPYVEATGGANELYAAFHAPRFAFLLRVLGDAIQGGRARVLDVGASALTEMIARRSWGSVDSLGLEPDAALPHGRHYQFDLNDTQEKHKWRMDLGHYDVIVMAEVLEHLYTAPELVMSYLLSLLSENGTLVLQTPNAAALRKRLKLLIGRNPYEQIRTDRSNPGHFREYTGAELRRILDQTGFVAEKVWMRYYFDARFSRHETGRETPRLLVGSLKNVLYSLVPRSLQEGITILAKKRGLRRE